MTDLAKRMEGLKGQVQVDWNPDRERNAERGVHRRRRRRAVARAGAGAMAIALLLAGGFVLARLYRAPDAMTMAQNERVLRFEDGSLATLNDAASVTRTSNEPDRTVVEIVKGGARFEVTRNPTRVFRVEAGRVAVEVLGTKFSVDRLDGKARVSVQSGRVRVIAPSGTVELAGGESGEYEDPPVVAADEPDENVPTPGAKPARKGPRASGTANANDSAQLFAEADVARMSRHPADAVEPLKQIIQRYPADLRTPMAAFQLGLVYLDLGRPADAAPAFATSQKLAERLSPNSSLAEDALAREVEAWYRGHHLSQAKQAAREYVARYPRGQRLAAVKKFGGIE
jgi:transmembrane sensor